MHGLGRGRLPSKSKFSPKLRFPWSLWGAVCVEHCKVSFAGFTQGRLLSTFKCTQSGQEENSKDMVEVGLFAPCSLALAHMLPSEQRVLHAACKEEGGGSGCFKQTIQGGFTQAFHSCTVADLKKKVRGGVGSDQVPRAVKISL